MYGFYNKIPPEVIGGFRNLQVISKLKNIKKVKNYLKTTIKNYLKDI